jgi:predicted TIM-barrel fold metal-dependent hydrolase
MRVAHCSRRELLVWGAGGAVGLAAAPSLVSVAAQESASQSATPPAGWIDAHSHIWTPDVQAYPLAAGKTVEDLSPARFTAEELRELGKRHQVERVVLICHHPYYGFDNRYLLDSARRFPQAFRIVGALDEMQPHPDARMRELLPQRVTGFRITPFVSGDSWLEGPGMERMWRTARETNQAMCCLINPDHLPQVQAMCEKHPRTPVVIDHFARIGMDGEIRRSDLEQLCRLSRFEKVHVKISAFYALGQKKPPYHDLVPMIRRLYGEFGPERLMWASDAPYQLQGDHTYRASISLVRDHLNFLSEQDRDWLLYKTAEKVFFFS